MEPTEPVTWTAQALGVLKTIGTTLTAFLLAFIIRRTWQKCAVEYDRPMLVFLGTDSQEEALKYENVPVIVGQAPMSERAQVVEPDLDTRNVIGFVVGKPKDLDRKKLRKMRINPNEHPTGYYAQCVIFWQHAKAAERFQSAGFHVRKIELNSPQWRRPEAPTPREKIFIGFGTDAPADRLGNIPHIAHIVKGPCGPFRYQPYRKGGFDPEDIKYRQLSPPTKFLIQRIKNPITKEWRDA